MLYMRNSDNDERTQLHQTVQAELNSSWHVKRSSKTSSALVQQTQADSTQYTPQPIIQATNSPPASIADHT